MLSAAKLIKHMPLPVYTFDERAPPWLVVAVAFMRSNMSRDSLPRSWGASVEAASWVARALDRSSRDCRVLPPPLPPLATESMPLVHCAGMRTAEGWYLQQVWVPKKTVQHQFMIA